MSDELKYQQALAKIKAAQNILLVCHVRPDGDAVSSMCAIAELVKNAGKKFTAFCADKPDKIFNYLDNFSLISSDLENLDFASFDLIIVLDCGSVERTGVEELLLNRRSNQFIIEIDHHPKIKDYADLEIRSTAASATAELVYSLFKVNKIRINKAAANCILTGIMTDTANFLYPSTSRFTLDIASQMMVRGAQFPQIVQKTWYNKNLQSMQLWGLALSRLTINQKYNFAFSILTQEDIKNIGAPEDVFDAIAGYMSNLQNVRGILLLREESDGRLKGSLRSPREGVDVSILARQLGGGGHPRSSGFVVEGRLEKAGDRYYII
jgi:phosphoesterase RecJ-like protein